MLTETGRVVATEPGWLWVETIRKSTCGSCEAAAGCGHGILNRLGDGSSNYLKASIGSFPQDRFTIDDRVCIAIPERLLLDSAFIVYGTPLLTTLGGAALMSGLANPASDATAALGAVLGFLAGTGLVRLHAWWRRNDRNVHPRVIGPG